MEFTLFYKGNLLKTTTTNPLEKQTLRRHFHSQLKLLWQQPSLSVYNYLLNPPETSEALSILQTFGPFQFAPLVCKKIHAIAELNITLLRPGPPGEAIKSGDIDNRLKTLLDALKMPHEPNALPPGDTPREGETPFYVLLEDDSLITNISINTYQLLEERSWTEALLIVHVTVKLIRTTIGTIGF